MARPSSYSEEIADRICDRLMRGDSLNAICSEDAFPPESTVRQWVTDNREGFSAKYARAREIGADREFDQLNAIASEEPPKVKGFVDSGWVAWKRNQIDTMKWSLARKLPKKYGHKLDLNHSGELNVSLAERISKARKNANVTP